MYSMTQGWNAKEQHAVYLGSAEAHNPRID